MNSAGQFYPGKHGCFEKESARRRRMHFSLRGAVEVQHRGPLAFFLCLPDDIAVEDAGDSSGLEIAVEVEETLVKLLVLRAEAHEEVRRIVLGREEEGRRVGFRPLFRLLD